MEPPRSRRRSRQPQRPQRSGGSGGPPTNGDATDSCATRGQRRREGARGPDRSPRPPRKGRQEAAALRDERCVHRSRRDIAGGRRSAQHDNLLPPPHPRQGRVGREGRHEVGVRMVKRRVGRTKHGGMRRGIAASRGGRQRQARGGPVEAAGADPAIHWGVAMRGVSDVNGHGGRGRGSAVRVDANRMVARRPRHAGHEAARCGIEGGSVAAEGVGVTAVVVGTAEVALRRDDIVRG